MFLQCDANTLKVVRKEVKAGDGKVNIDLNCHTGFQKSLTKYS